jgi:hypothetical protein
MEVLYIFLGVVFAAAAITWYFQKDRRPEYWTFEEVQRTACPGGTIYDEHSLIRVKATLRLRHYWRCWRCDGRWRTQAEDIPDGGISVFEFNAVHPPRKRDRDV